MTTTLLLSQTRAYMPPSASGKQQTPLTLPPQVPDVTPYVISTYHIDEALQGGMSDVWPCTLNMPHCRPRQVAVKKLRASDKKKTAQRLIREVCAWHQLQKHGVHPYITELLGVVDIKHGDGRPGIVLPYYEYNDALSFIQMGKFNESKKGEIVLNIAEGLQHMHVYCNAVHGDMKLRNILFDSGGKPKICDFGLSRIMDTSGFTTATPSASISYTAPEILEKSFSDDDGSEETSNPPKLTSKEADIYAFAILTAEIFMAEHYFVTRKNNAWVAYQRITENNQRPSMAKVKSPKYFPLLEDCWQTKPDERLRIDQIIWALAGIKRSGVYYDPRRLN